MESLETLKLEELKFPDKEKSMREISGDQRSNHLTKFKHERVNPGVRVWACSGSLDLVWCFSSRI